MENASHNAMHQHRHEGTEYRRIELITGVVRRRRWTAAEKAALVAESLQPEINVSELARRRGVSYGLLQTWRRTAMRQGVGRDQVFVPLRIAETSAPEVAETAISNCDAPSDAKAGSGPISEAGKLELESAGLRVCFSGAIDTAVLRLVLTHIGRRA
jgi:transposase